MLDISLSILPESTLSGPSEYERIVGLEYRVTSSSSVPPANTTNTSSTADRTGPWTTDILVAAYDGRDTKLCAVPCVFSGQGGSTRGERRDLMSLQGRRDIVQASCSDPGPRGEIIVSFTERRLVSSTGSSMVTKRDSGLSRGTADTSPPGAGGAANPTLSYTTSGVQYEHTVWLHVINTDEFRDVTVREQPPPGASPSAVRSDLQCQCGYMLRRKQPTKDNIFWLRACDYTISGLQIKEVVFRRNKLEVKSVLEWNLAQMQLFHHWDPFTQRLTYLIDRPPDDLRVVRFFGHPEERRCEFNYVSRMKRPLFPGRPRALPWCTATSSNNASYHVTMLPIRYECEEYDYALCRQHMPTPPEIGSPGKHVAKIWCEVTLLRNLFDRVEVEIELERPVSAHHCRVAFLFVHGMIAVYLAGVCVHFIDVHHKDLEPRYLFGVSLKGASSLPESPRNIARATSSSLHNAPPGTSLATNTSSGSGNSGLSPLGSTFVQGAAHRDVVVLPIPSGNWIATPDAICIRHVGISKFAIWEYIADRLVSLGCVSSPLACSMARDECMMLNNAMHVVTAHFHFESNSSRMSAAGQTTGPSLSAPISGSAGEEYFANNLRDVLDEHWREIKPSFFTQLLLGEAYRATRTLSKAMGNPYYLFLSMIDDHYHHQLLDDIRTLKEHSQQRALGGRAARQGHHAHHQHTISPSSPRSTSAAPGATGASFIDDVNPIGHQLCGCGGTVQATSFRITDEKVKESASNTDPDWWIVRGIKLNFTLFGMFSGKNRAHPIKRIMIADARQLFSSRGGGAASGTAGLAASGSSVSLHDTIRLRLEGAGVPSPKAAQIGAFYEQEATKIIEDTMYVITKKEEELPARVQFYLLNHLMLAVHSIGQRLTSDLTERFARLAASSLPQVTVLSGMKAGLYTPAISTLDHAYPELHRRIQSSGIRFGQKLSDRDYAAATLTSRVPFTVASPHMLDFIRVRECGGCPSILLSAHPYARKRSDAPDDETATGHDTVDVRRRNSATPVKYVDGASSFKQSSQMMFEAALLNAPVDSRSVPHLLSSSSHKLARYHSVPSGSQSTRYGPVIPSLSVFQQWTSMNCVCATLESAERSREQKEYAICAYESGPTLQCFAKRALPRDASGSDASLAAFTPWSRWNGKRAATAPTPPAKAGAILGSSSSQPSGLVSTPYLHTSDTMRRERAREALQYAFIPFASMPESASGPS